MPAALSLPPRATEAEFEAMSSEPLIDFGSIPFLDRLLIASMISGVGAGLLGFSLSLVGV